ncbi:hypothetical protein [Legionella jordanis]|uniref:Phosphotransferase enzyme family protein n=1 Tax=Legionella jordanis TaxID=456 RepID=A0A0W0VGJ2_9GAMM|nr:hypothetical protein [Legionella jordanis]KTD19218.1 hypothetical protein Ljor_0015 [Legionella jordanis]RMW99846.1 hypothetical protein EAW55_13610 [Legionella jordanis]VEH12896.1 Uncharacterised protein [Legionella jordanis]HAT8714850.1 hypothetical protein [Legionella jordanis]
MKQSKKENWDALQEKVNFLKKPVAYLEKCTRIKAIETHMSWVFLTEHYAYKLKKPVTLPFLDLSSLSARKTNCCKECRINQELAAGIYLEVLPLMKNERQEFLTVGSQTQGEVVDYLLKMKRIPLHLTLDRVLTDQAQFSVAKLKEAANVLLQFYQKAQPIKLNSNDFLQRLKNFIQANMDVLGNSHYGLQPIAVKRLHEWQLCELQALIPLISQRVDNGQIRDCHGDLRPEHICLSDPPVIIDRLDFNDDLRIIDPCDELAYLTLECEFLGRADAGQLFITVYEQKTQDYLSPRLIAFYKSFRACLRARICLWHLDDPRISKPAAWLKKAKMYVNLALQALDQEAKSKG